MTAYNSLLDLIGNTPLVRLTHDHQGQELKAKLWAKVEYFNPGFSVKDRIAKAMIEDAEAKGIISPECTTIIEATSGNTGIGLALIAAFKGYKLILTMPESMSLERRTILRAYGAELVLTPAPLRMPGAIKKAESLAQAVPNSWIPRQFDNPANPEVHFKTTGPEIWTDCKGKIDIFISGVGTGGTLTGAGTYLKQQNPKLKIIAIEPSESAVISGNPAGGHKIQGIGAGFIPSILNANLIDQIITIHSDEAIAAAQGMAKKGWLVGISSGAILQAAFRLAQAEKYKDQHIVAMIPSNGERYLSSPLYAAISEQVRNLPVADVPA